MSTPTPGQSRRRALVIGATGGIGGEVAKALIAHGWRVRALSRNPVQAQARAAFVGPVEWVHGDAMCEADVLTSAQGASLIFHGANPPAYRNWRGLAIPMLKNAIAAARMSGARLIFPGNIYNFAPGAGPVLHETTAQHPQTKKGAVRVEMEMMLAEAARMRARALIVRAGDFFGPHQKSGWFGDILVNAGQPISAVTYPGRHDIGHAWAYLPDLAETIARLADIDASLADFEVIHFGGHWLDPGIEMAHAIARVVGRPELPIRGLPWWLFYLAAPFVRLLREVIEMRYLWQVPLRLDNAKLTSLLGQEPHTPLDQAVRNTLRAYGCWCETGWPESATQEAKMADTHG